MAKKDAKKPEKPNPAKPRDPKTAVMKLEKTPNKGQKVPKDSHSGERRKK